MSTTFADPGDSGEQMVLVGLAGTLDELDALRALGPQAVLGAPPHGSAAQLAAIALGRALPLTLLNDGLRQVFSQGAGLLDVLAPVGILAAWTVVTLAVAVRIFRWT